MSQERKSMVIVACLLGGIAWWASPGWSGPPVTEQDRYRDEYGLTPAGLGSQRMMDRERADVRPAGQDTLNLPGSSASAVTPPALSPHPPERTPGRVSKPGATAGGKSRPPAASGWSATLGWLAAMVVLILGVAALLRKHVPALSGYLPGEALQVLGKRPLSPRHTLHMVRIGSRILLIGSSPQGLTTLSEIRDPVEIDFIAGACREAQPNSVVHSFSQLLRNYHDDQAEQELRTPRDLAVEHDSTHPLSHDAPRDMSRDKHHDTLSDNLSDTLRDNLRDKFRDTSRRSGSDDRSFTATDGEDVSRAAVSDLAAVRLKGRLSLGAGLGAETARDEASLGGPHHA